MSADNYYYIDKDGDDFRVTMQLASDDELSFHCPALFKSLWRAIDYAYEDCAEYGVVFSDEVRQAIREKFND